jgi:hypothetical protein
MSGAQQALITLPKGPVNLFPMSANAVVPFPGPATAQIRFTSGGSADIDNGVGFAAQYQWLFSGGAASGYEINYVGSGLTTGSAQNTWLALSTTRTWSLTGGTAVSPKVDSGTISIRVAGATIPLWTFAMSLRSAFTAT